MAVPKWGGKVPLFMTRELSYLREVPKMSSRAVIVSILALGIASVPAFATITYCNSACSNSNTGMTYASFETAANPAMFPGSPITFLSGGLNGSGVYTDASGTIFTGSLNGVAEALAVSGTALIQTASTSSGQGPHSIAITLPSNTYAFGMFVTNASGGSSPNVGLVPVSSSSDWTLFTNASGSAQFFGIISTTPISNLYIGNVFGGGPLQLNSFVYGTESAATPEAPAFLMTGAGLIALQRLARRKTRLPS